MRSETVFPVGTPVVANSTVTGFGVVDGSVMSALPVGLTGAAVPATLVMRSVGKPATKALEGAPKECTGLLAAVRVKVSASRRMRPTAPEPP